MAKKKVWVITSAPEQPYADNWGKVSAINALGALDAYAIQHGYGGYSSLIEDPAYLEDVGIGTDQHGLYATYENTTIWAIPLDSIASGASEEEMLSFIGDLLSHDGDVLSSLTEAEPRVIEAAREKFVSSPPTDHPARHGRPANGEIKTIEFDGLFVSVKRNPKYGQLMVIVSSSEEMSACDRDELGEGLLEIVVDGGTIYDRDA